MKKRHLNTAMLIAALIGGVIGFILGEIVIKALQYVLPSVVLVGIYFALFAFCVAFMCFLSECFWPKITTSNWQSREKGKLAAIFLPITLAVFFVLGCAFQFIYSLGAVGYEAVAEPDDYNFVVDYSGSMYGKKAEYTEAAMKNMLVELDESKRAGYIKFTSEAEVLAEIQYMNDAGKNNMSSAISGITKECGGGTNIQNALLTALNSYDGQSTDGRQKSVVLVSDGIDYLDLDQIVSLFNDKNISVFVVGVDMGMGNISDFEKLADKTGGRYFDAQSVDQLESIFKTIGTDITKSNRLLLDHRYGSERDSVYYRILRIIMIALLGVALGICLGLLFDSKALVKNFAIGGSVTGVLAGIAIELGCHLYMNIGFTRFFSDVLLSLVISVFSAVIAYDNLGDSYDGGVFTNRSTPNKFGGQTYDNTTIGKLG